MRVCFDDVPPLLTRLLCFTQARFRGLWRQKEVTIRHFFSFLLVHKSPKGIRGKRNGGGERSAARNPDSDPGTTWHGLVMGQLRSDEKFWSPSQDLRIKRNCKK